MRMVVVLTRFVQGQTGLQTFDRLRIVPSRRDCLRTDHFSPHLLLSVCRFSKAFGEGIVVDLQLGDLIRIVRSRHISPRFYLVVLIGSDGDEGSLVEDKGAQGTGADGVVVRRLNDVQTGNVAMHGVEKNLRRMSPISTREKFDLSLGWDSASDCWSPSPC